MLGDGRLRYSSASFTADLTVDADGYVTDYPGLAEAAARARAR
ncbi:MAG: putative glycolipid-binding domain-containing protein [Micromonosporaceae bacterium]